jgi:uncharacterized repeat protein (TIGR03806 family)
MLRTFRFTALFLIVTGIVQKIPAAEPGPIFGIEKRIPWNDSHVVGFPGTLPPYRAVRAFPKLKVVCPIAIAHQPESDRLIILQQMAAWSGHGKILRIKDDPNVDTAEELLVLDGIAYGLAFHPDFEKNGFLFVGDNGPMTGKKKTRITRYTMDPKPPYKLDPKSAKIVIEWDSDGHNGGDVAFGKDGMLYVTSGDGTSDSDTNLAGQNLTHLLSKVLRLDVDHPEPGKLYSVPKDNPFVGKDGIRPETWAYGFRNPWRIHADRKTGDIWVGQNGQDLWEPVYLVQKGANYGWSAYEGSHPFYPERLHGPSPLSKPLVEHHHSEARSLTGGLVYRGDNFPELRDAYLYGDWSTGKIWGVKQEAGKVTWHKELTTSVMQITGFGLDSHGELLIADHGGNGFFRLERAPKVDNPAKFPTKLSETGLFASVKGHRPHPALVPYSVNAPLWSDGADKERFIAIPGDGQIEFGTYRGWNLPEGTVLVKTFSYESPSGSKRRFETRLTTKTLGQWYGYSYRWNDEQTEAELVPAEGVDTVIEVRDSTAPGGTRKQTWHYPSRAECMVCHSRAANFVLGLSSWQMNKVHDYGTVKADQLRTLGHLKLFTGDAFQNWDKDKAAREKHLVDPFDKSASLEARAKSYLHANCAICHVDAGGGNAQIDLEFTTPLNKMRLLDVKPLHDTFGIKDAKLIVPGDPERSILFQRIARRGPGQMPPLASGVVDRDAVELFRAWIKEMK